MVSTRCVIFCSADIADLQAIVSAVVELLYALVVVSCFVGLGCLPNDIHLQSS